MTQPQRYLFHLLALAVSMGTSMAADWTVPLGGNTFRTRQGVSMDLQGRGQGVTISDPRDIHSIYVHFDRPCSLSIAIKGVSQTAPAQLHVATRGQERSVEIAAAGPGIFSLGDVQIDEPGYTQLDLQLTQPGEPVRLTLSDMVITSSTPDLKVDYVRNNDGNMFYWGRRGPSVHLGYPLPKDLDFTHAYSEIMVPVDQDPIGAYYMANGFGQGYFGIQVNSESERRVLFSVWSPFSTDNPAEIPDEDRVVTTAKGEGVIAQDFGNEGSGGQSYLVYPWRAGVTYRFLTEVRPDGNGNTQYTSWFGDKAADEWRLIASFRRPKTDTYLKGFHSFLENFAPSYGQQPRLALYTNQCVRDTNGEWHAINAAKFTGDATARGRHRLDYGGGVEGSAFFLKNCGFFSDRVDLDQTFSRPVDFNVSPPENLPSLKTATP